MGLRIRLCERKRSNPEAGEHDRPWIASSLTLLAMTDWAFRPIGKHSDAIVCACGAHGSRSPVGLDSGRAATMIPADPIPARMFR